MPSCTVPILVSLATVPRPYHGVGAGGVPIQDARPATRYAQGSKSTLIASLRRNNSTPSA